MYIESDLKITIDDDLVSGLNHIVSSSTDRKIRLMDYAIKTTSGSTTYTLYARSGSSDSEETLRYIDTGSYATTRFNRREGETITRYEPDIAMPAHILNADEALWISGSQVAAYELSFKYKDV